MVSSTFEYVLYDQTKKANVAATIVLYAVTLRFCFLSHSNSDFTSKNYIMHKQSQYFRFHFVWPIRFYSFSFFFLYFSI